MTWIFLSLLILFTVTDIKWFFIPNLIVLPFILLGGYLTNNWLWGVVLFLIGSLMFIRKRWRGGDVKLIALTGMFLGGWAVVVFFLSTTILYLYRLLMNKRDELPYAPFLFVSSLLTIGTIRLLHCAI